MKKVSDIEAGELFDEQCPRTEFVWKTDRNYILPPVESVKEVLRGNPVRRIAFLPEIQDCDNFALYLHADIKRRRGELAEQNKIPKEEWFSWLIGETFAIEANGSWGAHNLNIVACEDGYVYMIEPQRNEMWRINPKKDVPLLIKV